MRALLHKNDFKEFQCKFKGHFADDEDIKELKNNPKFPIETICKNCAVSVRIEIDSTDSDYYIITEL